VKILVLGGGGSPERKISLKSARAVAEALEQAGFEVVQADPVDGLGFLEKHMDAQIVFPILHGAGGEDGVIQTELEARGIPFLGSLASSLRISFNKHLTREVLKRAGLPVADGEVITASSYTSSRLRHVPHVIKAVGGGSSIGTIIVRNPETFDMNRLNEVFRVSDEAVIEQCITGIEITVPIFDNKALPVVEIFPPDAGEFNYENKYNGRTKEVCPPESLSPKLQQRVMELAEQVHRKVGARHLSRVDMIVQASGEVVVLEINSIPGMTGQSIYPRSALAAGHRFPELMNMFVELVKRDYKLN
jgi:D-alanine-D-alanine ligase